MKTMRYRIIKREDKDGSVCYYIQHKRLLLWWNTEIEWNAVYDMHFNVAYETLEEAEKALGIIMSKTKTSVVKECK
jgi:hypothetical protein